MKQNKQRLYMSDLEFKPIHKFIRVTFSSIKYTKNTNSDILSLLVYNYSPCKITLPLGLLGYCETNATISPTLEVSYRVNNIIKINFLNIFQNIRYMSINIMKNNQTETHS